MYKKLINRTLAAKKNDLPIMPFYWGDWFKATDIQSLPREVRCVWFEMLGRMWESNERGYLTLNGKPMSDVSKASILGFGNDVKNYKKIEKKLEDFGIFSRRESDGAIYSRRIIKDIEISKLRAKAGSKGGSKTWGLAKDFALAKSRAKPDNEDAIVDYELLYTEVEKIFLQFPIERQRGREVVLTNCVGALNGMEDLKKLQSAFENVKKNTSEDKFFPATDKFFANWREKIPETVKRKEGFIYIAD